MKVLIYIFGEGDFKNDSLGARLVPTFASHLKLAFEKNGVPTAIFELEELAICTLERVPDEEYTIYRRVRAEL